EAVITVEKITKAAGETTKGKDGGFVKVTDVKEEDGKITIKFEIELPKDVLPPNGGGLFGLPIGIPGGVPIKGIRLPVPVPLPAPAPEPAPALPGGAGFAFQAEDPVPPAKIQIQIAPGVGKIGPPLLRGFFPAPGITLVD